LRTLAAARIQDHAHVVRRKVLQHLDQEARETERRRRVLTPRRQQGPLDHREERTIDQRVSVDQEQPWTFLFRRLYHPLLPTSEYGDRIPRFDCPRTPDPAPPDDASLSGSGQS